MQDTADTELHVELVSEVEGEVERVAVAQPLVAVVVIKSGPAQLMPLARLLSELRGCELSEAARRIESSSGIILRDATAHEAEALSQELRRQDVPFVLIPTRELPELAQNVHLFRIRVAVGGLRLRGQDGRSVDVKWNNILTVTCVRLEGRADEGAPAPSRRVLSIFTREPFACYQLSENIPAGAGKSAEAPYQPKVRFERLGRAIYETFPHSAQNKGMRMLSNYGLRGKWKGLTFDRPEHVQSYNYWLALLRKYRSELRGGTRPRYSIPHLRKVEFEPEARPSGSPTRYSARRRLVPSPAAQRPPIVLIPPEWMPEITRQVSVIGTWLSFATVIAAICLAAYIIFELLG